MYNFPRTCILQPVDRHILPAAVHVVSRHDLTIASQMLKTALYADPGLFYEGQVDNEFA